MTDVDEVADRLYAVLPEEFVAARSEAVAAARAAGDRELAGLIGALGKPTQAAWAVDLLVRADGDQVRELVELGALLREAQRDLDPAALRELGRQRQQVVAALARRAARLAADAGHRLGAGAQTQVEETLRAAVADPDAAEAVLSGRLTTALSWSGFGPVDVRGAVATLTAVTSPARRQPVAPAPPPPPPPPAGEPEPPAEPPTDLAAARAEKAARAREEAARRREEARRRAVEQARRRARAALRAARAAADQAGAAARTADDEATRARLADTDAAARVAALREQLAAAERTAEQTRADRAATERVRAEAADRAAAAQAEAEAAQAAWEAAESE